MQDPTPLKQSSDGALDAELRLLVRREIEQSCLAGAYLTLGLMEEAQKIIMNDEEPLILRMAELLGIDVQARIDYHANRIQSGG